MIGSLIMIGGILTTAVTTPIVSSKLDEKEFEKAAEKIAEIDTTGKTPEVIQEESNQILESCSKKSSFKTGLYVAAGGMITYGAYEIYKHNSSEINELISSSVIDSGLVNHLSSKIF